MADSSLVINFIKQIAPLIVTEGSKRGYKIFSTVIAQAIIESRYGQSTLATRAHNYFGLKCGTAWLIAGKPSVNMKTNEEFTVGKLTQVSAYFRKYSSMEEGVCGYYDFIATKRYANLKNAISSTQYAQYLKADGYATSSSYISTLVNTVKTYGLDAYDVGLVPLFGPEPYEVGVTYTTQQDLNVRDDPDGNKKMFDELTENAKEHAFIGTSGEGILKRGTSVTVYDIRTIGSCVWLKIPSGWICGRNSKNIYVL